MKILSKIFLSALIGATVVGHTAEAQDLSSLAAGVPDGSNETNGQNLARQITANLNTETQTVLVNIPLTQNNSLNYSNLTLSVKLNASNEAPLLPNLDSLVGNDFKVGYKYTWSFWPRIDGNTDKILLEICKEQGKPSGCASSDLNANLRRKFLNKSMSGKQFKYFSLGAETSHSTHSYNDATTLESMKEENVPYKLLVTYGGIIPPKPKPNNKDIYGTSTAYSVTYRRERSFTDQAARQICSPFGTVAGALQCNNLKLGAPAQTDADILEFEFRKMFGGTNGRATAIAARVFYDFEAEVAGAELPVWFGDKVGGLLTTGAKLGWRSDTDDVVASVFFGVPFPL